MSDPSSYRQESDGMPMPNDLKLKLAEQKLIISWKDGRTDTFTLPFLRSQCPCATCRTERESRSSQPFNILASDPTEIKAVNAKMVGNYAIQLFWSDGHQTGIFDFRFLHGLGGDAKNN